MHGLADDDDDDDDDDDNDLLRRRTRACSALWSTRTRGCPSTRRR